MAFKAADHSPALGIPQDQSLIVPAAQNVLPVRREGHGLEIPLALEMVSFGSGPHIPDTGFTFVARYGSRPIGAEAHTENTELVLDLSQFFPGLQLKKSREPITTT